MPEAIARLLDMGSYGVYVWPAYALAALVLGAMLGLSLKELRGRRRELDRHEQVARAHDKTGSHSP